jgi:hypothetical protein
MIKVLKRPVVWRPMIQGMNFVSGDERRQAPQSAYSRTAPLAIASSLACLTCGGDQEMSQMFELLAASHPSFVALATLRLPGHPLRRFTKEEAAILSRALDAVVTGDRREQQIYMSPIASDHDFDARVEQSGVVLSSEGHGDVKLDWSEARALAEELRSFAFG